MKKIIFLAIFSFILSIILVQAADFDINVILNAPSSGDGIISSYLFNFTSEIKAINATTSYDEFNDASVDVTKWSTSTAGGGSVTESGGFIKATSGGGAGAAHGQFTSTNLTGLANITALRVHANMTLTATGSGMQSYWQFGGQTVESRATSGNTVAEYLLIRLNSTTFNVTKDGAFLKIIDPTTNVVNARAEQTSDTGGEAANLWMDYVFYTNQYWSYNLTNSTASIYYANGTLLNTTLHVITGLANGTIFTSPTFSEVGNYYWNSLTCANNGTSTICNEQSTNNSFFYGYQQNSLTYNSETTETTQEDFELNITLDSGVSLNYAYLYYNNTEYGTTITSDGNNRSISKTITAPGVNGNTNVTFYFRLGVNGTEHNTTTLNQTVTDVSIDNCTANSIQIINYTLYDEDDRTLLSANTTMEVYIKLTGDLTGETFSYYAASLSENPVKICIANNLSADTDYLLESEVQYYENDRVTEYHILKDKIITMGEIPLAYDLYDLLTTSSTEYLITYKDKYFSPVEGATIDIQRQYLDLGQFLTVELPLTDKDGRTIVHLVSNDAVYNIIVRKNNTILATYTNVRAFCASAVGDCRINLNEVGSATNPSDFIDYLNVSYTTSYNDSSREYEFVFATTDGESKDFELEVVLFDNYQNDTICSSSLSSSAGSLSCTIGSTYGNGTAIAKIYVNDNLLHSETFGLRSSISDLLGNVRYIIAAGLIITLPLMAITSATMALIFLIGGIILAGALFLVDYGSWFGAATAFLWLIIVIVIILFKVNRSENG